MTSIGRQSGIVLASGLMLFAVMSLSMATVLGIATRELTRTTIHESLQHTARTADLALAQATIGAAIADTTETVVIEGVTSDGIHYDVRRHFLGTADRDDDESVADWHFVFTATARSRNGAEVVETLQMRVPAPPPVDPTRCAEPGCEVPPLCAPPVCEPALRADPEPVAWHLPDSLL